MKLKWLLIGLLFSSACSDDEKKSEPTVEKTKEQTDKKNDDDSKQNSKNSATTTEGNSSFDVSEGAKPTTENDSVEIKYRQFYTSRYDNYTTGLLPINATKEGAAFEYGFVNEQLESVIKTQYISVYKCWDGYCSVLAKEFDPDGNLLLINALIDKTGEILFKHEGEIVATLGEDIFALGKPGSTLANRTYALVDKSKNFITEYIFEKIHSFSNGIAHVQHHVDGTLQHALINAQGETIMSGEYQDLKCFEGSNYCSAVKQHSDKKEGLLIKRTGEVIKSFTMDNFTSAQFNAVQISEDRFNVKYMVDLSKKSSLEKNPKKQT